MAGALPNSSTATGLVLLTNACNLSYGAGCNELGVAHAQGIGTKADSKRAAELFERGCKHGSMTACFNLAVATQHGDGVAKDDARATALLNQACKGGHQPSCDVLTPSE
jgi:hypothetical protein